MLIVMNVWYNLHATTTKRYIKLYLECLFFLIERFIVLLSDTVVCKQTIVYK